MKHFIKIFLFLFSFTLAIYAQNDGAANTGLSFLKMGVSSRSISLGDAVVSFNEDASATHYNPALLFMGSKVNAMFMHNQQVLGIRTEYLAAKVKMEKFAFALSLNSTSIDDIEIREIPGENLGTFNAQNFALGLSAGYKINENLSIGLTGKFLFEKIYVDNANGFALDLGSVYTQNKLSVGAAISNIGSMNELRSIATKLPTAIRGGASYLIDLPKIGATVRIGLDGYKVLDGGTFHANSGAEFLYKDFLALRVGYQSGYENKNLTTGVGIKYKAFNLDYAFVPYKYSIGSSHTITLGTNF
ncbi:MAG TPA: PorV/PorQ family protein [Ignavibacteria bacterium]